jgi:LPS sulfotransferase NodH
MGDSREFFNPAGLKKHAAQLGADPEDFNDYLKKIKTTASSNGVVTIKVFPRHMRKLVESGFLPPEPGTQLGVLADKIGGEVVIVRLFRRDKLRQAISIVKARQSKLWNSNKKPEAGKNIFYDAEEISKCLAQLEQDEAYWANQFELSNRPPALELEYEDYVNTREETLIRIAQLLSLPNAEKLVKPRKSHKITKQSDSLNESWYKRFITEEKA